MALTAAHLTGGGNTLGGIIGDVINLGVGFGDYNNAREQGASKTSAAVQAFASFAWGEIYYGGMSSFLNDKVFKGFGKHANKATIGTMLLVGAAQAGVSALEVASEHTTKTMQSAYAMRGKLGSGHFNMSEAGYTMRQRSLNAIRSNGLNTQSVLGNEARTYMRTYG